MGTAPDCTMLHDHEGYMPSVAIEVVRYHVIVYNAYRQIPQWNDKTRTGGERHKGVKDRRFQY